MTKVVRLKISDLELDREVQSRVENNPVKVAEYSEAIRKGSKFPPITVFFDGRHYWVSDGFHRVLAAQQAGQKTIEAEVRTGTRRDAMLFAAGCNSKHGLPRTNEDKWFAVQRLLKDTEWRKWSDRAIAEHCSVGNNFVGKVRRSICARSTDTRRKFERNGKTHWQSIRRRRSGSISPKAIKLLRDNPIADSRDELHRLARKPQEQQVKIAQQLVSGKARSVTAASFKVRSEDRRAQLNREMPDLKRLGKKRTLIVDPSWPVPDGGRLSASQHYDPMPMDEIYALPIADVAADDAHLYLWVVRSFLKEGLDLVGHWGFELRSILTWVKTNNKGALKPDKPIDIEPKFGSGHHFRTSTEYVLFGVRGNFPGKRSDMPDVFFAPRGRHSEKPDNMLELVEAMSDGPYAEIFSRREPGSRDGWEFWGNEVGKFSTVQGVKKAA